MAIKKKSNFGSAVSKNAHRQRTESSSFGYLNLPQGVKIFSPDPDGRYKLDFLPYEVTDPRHPDRDTESDIAVPGNLWYRRPFKTHRNVGNGTDATSVVCLTSFGKKCPICEYRAKLMKEGADKADTDALKPSNRNLYVVIPLDSKKHEVEIHIFDISQAMFQKKLNEELEEAPENGIFPDLEQGKTVKVRFESKTFGSGKPFPEAGRIDFVDRDDQYDETILKKVPNLDELLKVLSYEALSLKFFEMEDSVDENAGKLKDDEDEQTPEKEEAPRQRKNPLASKAPEEEKAPERRKEKEKEKEPESKSEGPTWEDLLALSGRKLTRFCDDNKLKLDPDKYDEDNDLRKAIAEELGVTPPKTSRRKSEEEEPPKGVKKETSSSSKEKCPHGHVFGVDTSKYKECDDCKLWDDCDEDNLKRKTK
jgi:hypothetical protein